MGKDNSNRENKKQNRRGKFSGLASIFSYILRLLPGLLQQTILTTRPTIEAIGDIRRYRHTDYGLLFSASLLGIIIGVFVAIFHTTMEWAEEGFKIVSTEGSQLIRWQWLVFPLVPAIAGLLVGILRKTLFRGATIDGLHTVVEALVYREGRIDWRNSFKSIIFAALTISSGGGAGREGPTVVLGASLGSSFAQIFRLRPQQLRVLCGSGAAAAISGIFNAPLGGIVFALEGIIGEISIRSFAPLVISSVLSTATSRLLVGESPLLIAPELIDVSLQDYFFLALAGMSSGFVGLYFLKAYKWTAGWVIKTLKPLPDIWRPFFGGLGAGAILLLLPTMWETTYNPINYVIAGQGMPLIENSIFAHLKFLFTDDSLVFLVIIVAAATVIIKPISNAITLESSGAGGTMAPVIKVGAMWGFVFGSLLHFLYPETSPGLYALVCAGALLAGTYQIPLTGGVVLFEICHNYDLILPLIFSSALASFLVQKSGAKTFNPLQKGIVDNGTKLYPSLLTPEDNERDR